MMKNRWNLRAPNKTPEAAWSQEKINRDGQDRQDEDKIIAA
jgi:hypothetical protein